MRLSEKTIIQTLKKNMEVLIKYRVKNIGLFGSYVRGDQRMLSDIDLLVEFDMSTFDENFSGYFDNYLSLRSTLQELFQAKVDLVTNDMISHYFKPLMEHEIRYVKTAYKNFCHQGAKTQRKRLRLRLRLRKRRPSGEFQTPTAIFSHRGHREHREKFCP